MARTPSVPSYRLHKPSGQAVVTVRLPGGERRDVYLGEYNSPDSRREYARIIGELAAAPGQTDRQGVLVPGSAGQDATVDEILLAFWRHAEVHYRRADGSATNELSEFRQIFKVLRGLYGHTPARDFGPLALKAVRGKMVDLGWCRRLINKRINRVRLIFKWAASEQLVPVAVYQGLATVAGLQQGRTVAPDPEPVGPVDAAHVRAVLPHLGPHVRGMVELQLLTGMRPGEVCAIRPADVDTTGAVWVYRPSQHKTRHRGKTRAVAIGPKAQALLRAFEPSDQGGHYFSPQREVEGLRAARAAARKTPRWPSHLKRNADKRVAVPRRVPAERYDTVGYAHAVARAVKKANRTRVEAAAEVELHVPHWHPNQLRHTHATEVRKRFGLEAAQVVLGHERADVTQVYAEKNIALAATVAAEMG